jgi:hypothetical protein
MTCTWQEPAATLIDQAPLDWSGLRSVLDVAGHAALALSLAVPLSAGVGLAYAAIALGEAREELEWTHDTLPAQPRTARLGPLLLADDPQHALDVLHHLLGAAIDRTLALADRSTTGPEVGCLGRVLRLLHTADDELARVSS